jgi:hypothetical protein
VAGERARDCQCELEEAERRLDAPLPKEHIGIVAKGRAAYRENERRPGRNQRVRRRAYEFPVADKERLRQNQIHDLECVFEILLMVLAMVAVIAVAWRHIK